MRDDADAALFELLRRGLAPRAASGALDEREPPRPRSGSLVGALTDYTQRSREFRPHGVDSKYRHLCETWVKYHAGAPVAEELYKLTQKRSRSDGI